jgi:hypothetical protein
MLKGLLALMLFTSVSMAHAVQLRIENAFNVKVERYHQFRAKLYLNDGRVYDVTHQTEFSVSGYQQRANGEFLFNLPAFGERPYQVTVKANFRGGGYWAWRHQPVRVDTTPDRVELSGSTIAQSGDTTQFSAWGIFGTRRVEITNRGRWQCHLGQVNQGSYTAPINQSRSPLRDQVNFSYGFRTESLNIEVRRK